MRQRRLFTYGLPILFTLIALGITAPLTQPERAPLLVFFFAAILASAYFGGRVGGLVATGLAIPAVLLFFTERKAFHPLFRDDVVRLAALVIAGLIGIYIIDRLQKAVERERLLRALVETSPTLTLLADQAGRIQMFNHQCEVVTGYRRDEVVGKTISDLFLPPEWGPVVQKRLSAPDAPEVQAPHENPWKTKSGELRMIEWRCRLLRTRGATPLVLAIGVDVTEKKREAALQLEAERLATRAVLVNELAHEMNNPLQALANLLTLAQLEKGDGNGADHIRAIGTEVQRLSALSRKLLNVTAERDISGPSRPA